MWGLSLWIYNSCGFVQVKMFKLRSTWGFFVSWVDFGIGFDICIYGDDENGLDGVGEFH